MVLFFSDLDTFPACRAVDFFEAFFLLLRCGGHGWGVDMRYSFASSSSIYDSVLAWTRMEGLSRDKNQLALVILDWWTQPFYISRSRLLSDFSTSAAASQRTAHQQPKMRWIGEMVGVPGSEEPFFFPRLRPFPSNAASGGALGEGEDFYKCGLASLWITTVFFSFSFSAIIFAAFEGGEFFCAGCICDGM